VASRSHKGRQKVFFSGRGGVIRGEFTRPRACRSLACCMLHAPPPMTPKRQPTTPHRQRRGSRAAAERQIPLHHRSPLTAPLTKAGGFPRRAPARNRPGADWSAPRTSPRAPNAKTRQHQLPPSDWSGIASNAFPQKPPFASPVPPGRQDTTYLFRWASPPTAFLLKTFKF
jgi:hypothetical protein